VLIAESGLALLALGLSRIFHTPLRSQLQPNGRSFLWGVLATPPLLLALRWILARPSGKLRDLVDLAVDQLGPLFVHCALAELALIAAFAGIGEELLFRGVLQSGLTRLIQSVPALLAASILFGLAHAVTSTYAVVAGLMGLYLGLLFVIQGSLVAPVLTHALYDFVALILVVRLHRASLQPKQE
jgi:membrane protease YdiL (CAAX protease family)